MVERKHVPFTEDDIQIVFPERYDHLNEDKWRIEYLDSLNGNSMVTLTSDNHALTANGFMPSAHYTAIDEFPEWGDQLREFLKTTKPLPYTADELMRHIEEGDVELASECAIALATQNRVRKNVENLGRE